ncbi:hypothetical protein LBBP_02606 [Leptospira borgpetersenii serovar Ballum]|uniref:Uncharacterized protein n=1 Tax=Leptospira borgpetersenii serovar Ballum TaxID=280505 RepID=A0A0S2IT53_LEPBO|nr:hypothetical protein LBBP_02606 [Leptospira borgpetersenii serovar Ballum]
MVLKFYLKIPWNVVVYKFIVKPIFVLERTLNFENVFYPKENAGGSGDKHKYISPLYFYFRIDFQRLGTFAV